MNAALICFAMSAANVVLFASNPTSLLALLNLALAVFCFGLGIAFAIKER